ncbi:OLC1v1022694C1 [Oldenlandia corymbosa var. corymbosa]|uniref:Endoglucanase n=1 Tax=Oldenlandia corymbosa var. corymbosa TaxID=529605 RepID=A0AAV1BYN3_OLDCO|nr:OLC1v1022694C1 [Oldenlandia corymbosa var. corymbosa]
MSENRKCRVVSVLPLLPQWLALFFFFFISALFQLLPLSQSLDFTSDHYKEALHKSLLYFEAQRSGHLPYNQRVTWRHHSGLTDGLEQGVDLVGGYYDAGDNVKFGLPMAFTITMLSWTVIQFRDEIVAAGEYQHALEAIKWGTDYFIKAHPQPHVLWVQANGDTDHYCWQRPEDMTTSRRAYKIDEEHPGSDVAGETAAAMAAASIVFRETNPHYSHLLLHHAQQLFEFGDKYRGKYDESIGVAEGYYPSVSGYMDELLWAALWLYKSTDNSDYLSYAIQNAHSFGGITWSMMEFSWDVKYAGLQIIGSMLPAGKKNEELKKTVKEYKSKAEYYVCACLNKNNSTNVDRTPGGLLYIRQWNNMQYVSTATFLLMAYSDHLHATNQILTCNGSPVTPDEIFSWAKTQVDYILGSNPMGISYMVGHGPRYPQRVHHRGASMESYKNNKGFIGCTQGYDNYYGRKEPNQNVLVGALVGGPDKNDQFRDKRGNYMQTEACTYNVAPLVGVFARLHALEQSISSSGFDQPLVSSI